MFDGKLEIKLSSNLKYTCDAEGKWNAPGEMVVIELLPRWILTKYFEGKLNAQEGIVVILLLSKNR